MFSSVIEINTLFNLELPDDPIILNIFNNIEHETISLNTDTNYWFGCYHEHVAKNMEKMKKHFTDSNNEQSKERLTFYESLIKSFSNEIVCECGATVKRDKLSAHIITKKHLKLCASKNIDNSIAQEIQTNKTTNNAKQQEFINSPIQKAILVGSAGCGKTRTIIEFCINKYKNKIIKTSNDFLIVTFSRKACDDFVTRGKNSTEPKLFNTKNIRTFHSLAYLISKTLFNIASESQNTIIISTLINCMDERVTKDIIHGIQLFKTCKFIFIDEAQDINNNQYNLTKLLCEKLEIPFILVGDPNQNIYQFQGGTDKYLFNTTLPVFYLVDNYRSTVEIVDFCNQLRPYNSIFPKMVSATGKHGNQPIIFSGSNDEILEDILKRIANTNFKLEEIAIIGSVKKANYNDRSHQYMSTGLNLILNHLDNKNIPFIKHYKDGNEVRQKDKFEIKEGHINLLTSHGSKGLEFKLVFVLNFHFTTQSKRPTKTEYNNFKYLWYVTVSRAEEEMVIYVDDEKQIFPTIEDVTKTSYTTANKPFAIKPIHFEEERKQEEFHVTDIINSNKYFNEDNLFNFKNEFKYTIITENLFEINNINIHEHAIYSALYGIFVETLFTYYYYKNKNNEREFIDNMKNDLINSLLFVEKKYSSNVASLKRKGVIGQDSSMYVNDIDETHLTNNEREFIRYCQTMTNAERITIHIKLDVFEYNEEYIINLIDGILCSQNVEKQIFDIVLYFYQIENESKYLLKYDFTKHLESLSIYFEKFDTLSKNYDGLKFQQKNRHPNINLCGFADILHNDKIIEIKFVTEVTEKHIIQILLYYNNIYPNWKPTMNLEIWNLFSGVCHKIQFDLTKITNWKLNCFLCDVLDVQMENNIFMMDLETNSKSITNFPIAENSEIIDRYVYEYGLKYEVSDGLIKNKYPLITSHINGIYAEHLLDADENLNKFKDEIDNIMLYCANPIFVAHNGHLFDFKVMLKDGLLNADKVKFLDTKYILRLFMKNEIVSDKLCDIYNKVMGVNHTQTHRAKGDTMMIVDICNKLELSVRNIVEMVWKKEW